MNTKQIYLPFLIAGSFALSACSNLTFKKESDKIAQVKKVAIVSIASTQPRTSAENILHSLTSSSNEMHVAVCTSAKHISPIAKVVAQSLQKTGSFDVIPIEIVEKNSNYQEINQRIRKGGIAMLLSSKNSCYHDDELIDYYHWNRLRKDEVQKIKTALGVDAVIRILVESEEKGVAIMGVAVGGAKTSVRLSLEMYNGIEDSPIWYDTNAQGEVVKDGTVSVMGFADRDVLNQKTLIGTESAAAKLVEHFQKI